jgi:hypothetical protein
VIERASSNDTNAFSAIALLEVVIEPRDRAIIMLYLQVGLTCSIESLRSLSGLKPLNF